MELTELRNEIDQIDKEMVHLFCQRMNVASKVAQYKKANGSPIYHPEREREILEKVSRMADPEMEDYIKDFYVSIFQLSRNYQSKCVDFGPEVVK